MDQTTTPTRHTPFRPDSHYQHLASALPSWLTQASTDKRDTLRRTRPGQPAGFTLLAKTRHQQMTALTSQHWTAQNLLEQTLSGLQDANRFATPILQAEILKRFGLELDVSQTFMRLYLSAHIPWLRLKSGAARTWTVSLLAAALHNFEESETGDDAFEAASTYLQPPTADGQFTALPQVLQRMPIASFTRMCRELDLGARYKAHLQEQLAINDPARATTLQSQVQACQKSAFAASLHMASLQGLIDPGLGMLINGVADGLPHLRLHGQEWHCHDLTIMGARLTGITLFAPDLEQASAAVKVVAYIPDDPHHPIKQYPSAAAFAQELVERLRNDDYQQFFSRFINHEDRGHFFGQLNNRLGKITWQPVPAADPRPTWRYAPTERPDLQLASIPINGALWNHLYQRAFDKILNDAEVIAVSTVRVDQKARWALWDSFIEIASTLLEIAAFVVAPFIPFAGELMLAYMAYQLLDDTFEAVIDWAEGKSLEAFEHFMAVIESVVQAGTFAVGGTIVAGELRAALPASTLEFFDRCNLVKTPSEQSRYWEPDLGAYEHPDAVAQDSQPDARGLHEQQGKKLMVLNDKPYAVSENPLSKELAIDHPTRVDAYKPRLEHRGSGAWKTELDQPLTWDRTTLLRRLDPDMERFPAQTRERMLEISGCNEDTLRKIHVEGEQTPALLADTLQRFKIDQDIQRFIDQLSSSDPAQYRAADPSGQLQLLQRHGDWPADKGLRLIDGTGQTLWQSPDPTLPMTELDTRHLHEGDLLQSVLLTLTDEQIRTLTGEAFGAAHSTLAQRAQRLRRTLADLATRHRQSLFADRYRPLQHGASALQQKLIDAQPGLPKTLAQALLDTASDIERQQLQRGTTSERLAALSQEAALQTRVTRAYEGLELRSTADNLDTDRLVLHTLEQLPDWSGQLRLEVRQYTDQGTLLDSIGEPDAPWRKVLVLTTQGSYQAFDAEGLQLHGEDSLYASLLHALPDSERTALDMHIDETEKLRQQIRDHALDRRALRSLLANQPLLKPSYDPSIMRLLGGTDGYHLLRPETPTLQAHAHQLLPDLPAEQLQAFVEHLQRQPGGPRAELTRLFTEHAHINTTLNAWIDDIPLVDPHTRIRLSAEQSSTQKYNRRQWRNELLYGWRQQTALVDPLDPEIDISFAQPIIGDLPRLNLKFERVGSLTVDGHASTRGVNGFLQSFHGLRRLALRNLELGRVPEAITQSPQLDELILSDCAITLTPDGLATLQAQTRLSALDLYKNPLGLTPSVESMPLLNYLDLSETAIGHFPHGLLNRPQLRTALLNNNRIQSLPSPLFSLPDKIAEGFDLAGNPLGAADRERIKLHFSNTRQDFGVLADPSDIVRVQALYPQMDQEMASELLYLLPGSLHDGTVEITRRENELRGLTEALARWADDLPQVHPLTGEPFTAAQLLVEQAARETFSNQLELCWRRETELDDFDEALLPTYELNLSSEVSGELPVIDADFSHVSHLYMKGHFAGASGVGRFVEYFPNLKGLTLYEYRLGNIPEAIFRMSELTYLALSDCEIVLTPQSALELAEMAHLDALDLSSNPLGRAPDISQMSELSVLMLDNTGITELPPGLLQLQNLDLADLSDNAISHVPSDILELTAEFAGKISLRGNPLSAEAVQQLIVYFRQNRIDFGVDAVINGAELEVSSSTGSEVDE